MRYSVNLSCEDSAFVISVILLALFVFRKHFEIKAFCWTPDFTSKIVFSCHPSYSNTLSFHLLITKPQNFKGKCVLSEKELQQSDVFLQSEVGLVCEHQGHSLVVSLSHRSGDRH